MARPKSSPTLGVRLGRLQELIGKSTGDGEELVRVAVGLLTDTTLAASSRLAALAWLADRYYGRVPVDIKATVEALAKEESVLGKDYSHLPLCALEVLAWYDEGADGRKVPKQALRDMLDMAEAGELCSPYENFVPRMITVESNGILAKSASGDDDDGSECL